MQRRGGSGQPVKGQRKPRKAPTARVSTPDLQKQVAALTRELTEARAQLTEALEYQTATGEVLKVISRSPTDVQPVFDMIAESAARLCEGQFCFVYRFDGQLLHFVAHHSLTPEVLEMNRRAYPAPPSRRTAAARAILERGFVQIPDINSDPDYILGAQAVVGDYRSVVGVPILRDGLPIGSIAVARAQAGLLPDRQIELLKTFADQAAIAIENVRLFEAEQQRTRDLSESLERQTATSEVLRVISSSQGELEPVFQAMLENATRICEAKLGILLLSEGDAFRTVALYGAPAAYAEVRRREPIIRYEPGTAGDRVARTKQPAQIADIRKEPAYVNDPRRFAILEHAGARTMLNVPMLKKNELVGQIAIYRQEVRPFTDKQIALLENFGAQAVIAIENTRLLSELRESLQQQTATANVFKVISRSTFELNPVLETLVESAATLCQAERSAIYVPETGSYQLASSYGYTDELKQFLAKARHEPGRGSVVPRVLLEGKIVHIPDVEADSEYTFLANRPATVKPWRTVLGVPLLREGKPIGVFVLTRAVLQPFDAKQIELIATFADQAVIAIENTRLLNELRESLQQQTATADVLKVISGSVYDLKPVFEIIGQRAEKLCDADLSVLSMVDGDLIRLASINGVSKEGVEAVRNAFYPMRRDDEAVTARTIRSGMICHVYDVLSDPLYAHKDAARAGGFRGSLGVPMIRDGQVIGAIFLARKQPGLFTDNQIQLVKTFADQAVIAIENARLFNETKEALERQTATADVLKAISRSTFDLGTVLQTLVEAAARLCDADQGTIAREHGGVL